MQALIASIHAGTCSCGRRVSEHTHSCEPKHPVHSVLDVQIIEIEQQRSLRFKTNTDSSVCKLVWLKMIM